MSKTLELPLDPVDREIARLMHKQIAQDEQKEREHTRMNDEEDHAVLLMIAED